MCPMCEKRAQMLAEQAEAQESDAALIMSRTAGSSHSHQGSLASYLRNPFKICKNLTHQCTSPQCESRRMSVRAVRAARRSTVRPSLTPLHSGDLANLDDESRVSESSSLEEASPPDGDSKSRQHVRPPHELQRYQPSQKKKHKGFLTKLKHLTTGPAKMKEIAQDPSDDSDSSFAACGKKVLSVIHDLEHEEQARESSAVPPYVAESDVDTISELSLDMTETSVSETAMLSMMNMNGSGSSPRASIIGTMKSSTFDDDASSFAIVPRTSLNSSRLDWASDASGLSDRFGELDIGYLSLEESGEAPEFDDTVSISSSHPDDLDLNLHPGDETVSESELDQDYSISTDSQEWLTDNEEVISHRSRAHIKDHPDPPDTTQPENLSTSTTKISESSQKEDQPKEETTKAPEIPKKIEHVCSHCGQKEQIVLQTQEQQPTTKKVTRKDNPMSAYFHTYLKGADHAVVAAKVVVLLGKYGNRKGLRVAGLPPVPKELQKKVGTLSEQELGRLNQFSPTDDAVTAFQNEVARMMLEGVDVPALNIDVEQFLAGYVKLHSPFYIDLIEDFFKSVCMDCFGQMGEVKPDPFEPEYRRPESTVVSQKIRKSTNNG